MRASRDALANFGNYGKRYHLEKEEPLMSSYRQALD